MHLRRRLVSRQSKIATPATAVLTSVALVAAATFGGNHILRTQSEGGPIQATTNTASFGDGETVVVDDPAIASQGAGDGPRAVKQFHQDEPFSTFGVTWQGHKDVAVFVRAKQEDGTWSEWFSAEPTDVTTDGTNGTDPIWVGETHDVQVSVGNVDLGTPSEEEVAEQGGETQPKSAPESAESDKDAQPEPAEQGDSAQKSEEPKADKKDDGDNQGAGPLPSNYGDIKPVADIQDTAKDGDTGADSDSISASDLEAVFIDGKTQSGIEPAAETVADGMPPVVSRAGWGADEGIRCMDPDYDDGVKALTLHHTAGSNNYSKAEAAAVVRGIYAYHAQNLGWCDIGYNALVDKYGTIYEGRYGGLDKAVQGAHVGGFNQNTWGISMMGNYQTAQPTQEQLQSVANIAGWKAAISGFDPTGQVSLTSQGFNGSKYPAGSVATVPAFQGHRDFHYTTCPSDYTVAQWPTIRKLTKQKYDQVRSGGTSARPSTSPSTNPSTTPSTTPSHSNNPAPQPKPAPSVDEQSNASQQSGGPSSNISKSLNANGLSSQFTPKQKEAFLKLASAVGTLALAAGVLQAPEKDQEIAGGMTATQIADVIGKVLRVTGDQELQSQWGDILNAFGPLLGVAQGGPDMITADNQKIAYQLFDNGVVMSSEDTGAHALVGEIAKAWADGENAASLGLPITDQYSVGKDIRVDFQGGYINYNAKTKQVDVFTN
ncbi:N-acetylmuramoyl-L-alanine amidase [Corynebacterium massiliense DSM 45435]|uniref:N-acetylmuramoyl-L-alanine amidase n=1 Tax=Corynebacterium massiliense DSM 45435 TaxID=1121364 RepID=A0ABY7UBE9_9CORY|nr:N-acetylmuramoyl-L-alanine amidase [Corynebacterium massiliense DSM 45435]